MRENAILLSFCHAKFTYRVYFNNLAYEIYIEVLHFHLSGTYNGDTGHMNER